MGEGEFRTERLQVQGVHPTYNEYSQGLILNEMKEDMLFVSDEPADERAYESLKEEVYELPDGQ